MTACMTALSMFRCPRCGSDMVLEREETHVSVQEEAEEVSLGIPACEMLDLAVMSETSSGGGQNYSSSPTERSFQHQSSSPILERHHHHHHQSSSPIMGPRVAMSVKADIHCHTINSPHTNLPDLLPR